jgi:hypothetical protein
MRDAIEAVADQLLSGNAPIQKPYDVTWYRHTLAANQGLKSGGFGPRRAETSIVEGASCAGVGKLDRKPLHREIRK